MENFPNSNRIFEPDFPTSATIGEHKQFDGVLLNVSKVGELQNRCQFQN